MNSLAYKLGQTLALETLKIGNAMMGSGNQMSSPLSAIAPQAPTNIASPPAIPRANPTPAMPVHPPTAMPKMALFISDPANPPQRALYPADTRQSVPNNNIPAIPKAMQHMTVKDRFLKGK